MIERVLAATKDAGLKVEGIDLSAFGMVRALAGRGRRGAQLYVNVAGLTNVAVANESGCLFTRAAAGGLDAIVATLAERRGLTLEHARSGWPRRPGDAAGVASRATPSSSPPPAPTLDEGVHQLADTVRNSLNFYRMQDNAETVERALLTGPAVVDPRPRRAALRAAANLPVEAAVVAADEALEGDVDPGASPSPRAWRSRSARSPRRHRRRGRVRQDDLAMTLRSRRPGGRVGPIIGSFLNVVAYRLPRGESLDVPGARAARRCGTPIKPYDNVPVLSWLCCAGAAGRASKPISPRYPLVEAVTARLCVAVVLAKGADWTPARLAFVLLLVPITLIDLDHRIIPNTLDARRHRGVGRDPALDRSDRSPST